jgi:hypothetical protein
LGQAENTSAIFQGLITSADHIYHLKKNAKNRYLYTPQERRTVNGKTKIVKLAPVAVEIEDAIMRPLVSGADVKRFIEPQADTYLLFPYQVDATGARLFTSGEMQTQFPKAWKYLKGFENELRRRENRSFDDDAWYRFGRHQGLDKQETPKLLVAQLVPELRLSFDERGVFYINNVRVNGILPRSDNGWFLLGTLNSPVSDYIFKWLGKPKNNAYYEANKQFIAPLPIPRANRADRAGLSALAKGMQERRTRQVELRSALNERLAATARVNWPLEKILPNVRSIAAIEAEVPKSVPRPGVKKWVDERRKEEEEAALAEIDGVIQLDSAATVVLNEGKLSFRIDEQEVARVFVSDEEATLVEAQWRAVAIDFEPTQKGDAKRLIDRLRKVAVTAEAAVGKQIIGIGKELADLSAVLRDDEEQLHEMTCYLFKLTDEERRLVERTRV